MSNKVQVTYKDIHEYFLNRAKGCAENKHLQWLSSLMTVDAKVSFAGFFGTTSVYVTDIAEDGTLTIINDSWKNIDKKDNESKLAMQIQKLEDSKFDMEIPVKVKFIDKETGLIYENRTLNWDLEPPRIMFVK